MFFMPQNSLDASDLGPLDEDDSTISPRALAATVNNGGQHHPFAKVTTTGLQRSTSGGASFSSSDVGAESGGFRSVINPLQQEPQQQQQQPHNNQVGRGGRIAITVPDSEAGGTGAGFLEPQALKHSDSKVSFVHKKQQRDGGGNNEKFADAPPSSSHRVAKPTMTASMSKSTRSNIYHTT